ncbi:GntR family transcriptional regulator [Rhodococcus sp. WS3]|uniref:GntR family transcriptional regulator n=1 Tax=unclassified Rhodococcus (in: high G+C Gram-positive bacteria) TaxID=192944 RepID=UPI0005D391BE|nr:MULTISPECIES: GntR family transcriptional regulator [unclassified Rhodococcus (in: high G+C Gram-positive bacteria)]KJF19325.1 putative HTH-type transcriptional regulator ydfH [Rhodococcus sp. AD45]ROZ42723.1 GntR family transcriptional regulator [Rhodococcus sp. WS3]RZL21789.1 MAG: GntR family transcriptional regulator [Rhodococcus sp. (in: high G+C Gram-positive bacteria)]
MPHKDESNSPKTASKAAAGEVYSILRDSIVASEIPPGTRMNIDAIARELGVSQTPIREALQRLEGDNLVIYSPGRGYSTTPLLNLPELRALFEFRLLVEPWAARSAAVDRLANPGHELDQELNAFKLQIDKGGDLRQDLVAHDTHFHGTILRASGNRVVQQAFNQTHCHLHTFRLYPADVDGSITVAEHRRVWDAIRNCDPVAAEQSMADHIRNSFTRFAQAFEETLPPLDSSGATTRSPKLRIAR